jgi:hypothetical protein
MCMLSNLQACIIVTLYCTFFWDDSVNDSSALDIHLSIFLLNDHLH